MCTETPSPRISFSRDLDQSGLNQTEPRRDATLLDSDSEFEFNISRNLDQESSTADELFANGMILPFQNEDKKTPKRIYKYELPPLVSVPLLSRPPPLPPPPPPLRTPKSKKENSKLDPDDKNQQSKSFWGFKRSSSLNYDIKKSLICSFPLLSRSNSTGSVLNSKRAILKHGSGKQGDIGQGAITTSSSSASSLCCNVYHIMPQKPALKGSNKHGGRSYNGNNKGVFSVPSPYISKFGFGSFFRYGKDKKKKKK